MNDTSFPIAARGSFAWARAILAKCGRLSPKDVALLLEHNPSRPLPDDLREAAVKALSKNGPRGRKRVVGTPAWDFMILDAWELYANRRIEYAAADVAARRAAKSSGEKFSRTRLSPSDRALDYVLEQMDLKNIGRRRLRNLFSVWKYVRDWEPPED